VLGEDRLRTVAVDGTDDAPGAPDASRRAPWGRRALPVLWQTVRSLLTAPPGSVWRDPVTWTVALLAFGAYFAISLFRLLQLTPGSYDLGIYTEYVKQLSQLHAPVVDVLAPGFNLLGNHFQIAVGVIAPLFRVFPSPATLLFFQALCAAVSVFPVVTTGTALAGRSTGRLIGFARDLLRAKGRAAVFGLRREGARNERPSDEGENGGSQRPEASRKIQYGSSSARPRRASGGTAGR
jgi:hypothetical protein